MEKEKLNENKINHAQAASLKFVRYYIPKSLLIVLSNNLRVAADTTDHQRDYIKCIKSISNVRNVESEHYFFLFHILLYLEEYADLQRMQKYNLQAQLISRSTDQTFNINVASLLGCDDNILCKYGTVIIKGTTNNIMCYGTITDILYESIIVTVRNQRFLRKFSADDRYNIIFVHNDWSHKCCHLALNFLQKHNMIHILYPIARSPSNKLQSIHQWFNATIGENACQKQAIFNILNKSAHPAPYIIFGPPGTGKTSTIVEIICQIWHRSSSESILLCTQSNSAADRILKCLIKYPIPSSSIHRMYSNSYPWNAVDAKIRPYSNFIQNEHIRLPKSIIRLKRIVIVTLISSLKLQTLALRSHNFSYIIIDEASQATEPEMLVPMTLAIRSEGKENGHIASQFVIVGDHHQLGPTVISQRATNLLGISMLERLINSETYRKDTVTGVYNPNYITKLVENYRNHESILHVPNKLFYGGDLVPVNKENVYRALQWRMLPNPKFPLIFCQVNATEQKVPKSNRYNESEVAVVMWYLEKLIGTKLGNAVVQQSDIGIITPYRAQQKKIQNSLENKKWMKVSVGTTEHFQGQERDIIIISTVRTRNLGFLSNYKRFNVAVTRARALLIVIGHKILRTSRHWNTLLQYCEKNHAVNHVLCSTDLYAKLKVEQKQTRVER